MKLRYGAELDLQDCNKGALLKGIAGLVYETAEGVLPFAYATADGEPGFNAAMTGAYRGSEGMVPQGIEMTREGARLLYFSEDEGLEAAVEIEFEAEGVFRQRVRIKNVGQKTVELTMLSCFLPLFSYRAPLDQRDYELLYCTQTWYGEGQWHAVRPEEVGLFDCGGPPPTASFEIAGLASQTTSRFFPHLMLRDKKRKRTFFCELEPTGSWMMNLGLRRNWWKEEGCLTLLSGSAEDRTLGFCHALRPGESYTSADCLYGAAEGGPDQALRAITRARRCRRRRSGRPLVIFNDYMNCLWADPDSQTCLNLAALAAKVGADAYVMDSGWFARRGEDWSLHLGEWGTDSDRFEEGLGGFFRKIREMGLVPGVWFEIEVCNSEVAERFPADWFVCSRGVKVGGKARKFFNFTNPKVRTYLTEKIEALLRMGVRVIKNDYNDSYSARGEEAFRMQENFRAFFEFFESLYCRYPDLVVENCGSGAMRSDGQMLNHFALQSVSDQDDYRLYPSIVKGSLMNVLPEQLGIWCMPHPVHCSGRDLNAGTEEKDLIAFNFVSALAGTPYLSGRLDLLSEEGLKLVAAGVALAKNLAGFVRTAYPELMGFSPLSERGWEAMALADERGEEKLLYFWRLQGEENFSLPVGEGTVEQLFPPEPVRWEAGKGKLNVWLERPFTAVLFRWKGKGREGR